MSSWDMVLGPKSLTCSLYTGLYWDPDLTQGRLLKLHICANLSCKRRCTASWKKQFIFITATPEVMTLNMMTLIYIDKSLLINDKLGEWSHNLVNYCIPTWKLMTLVRRCLFGCCAKPGLKVPEGGETFLRGSNRVGKKQSLLNSKYLQTEL